MSTQTTNYNLEKPSQDEKYDIDVHNGNMDVIDSKLSELNEWKNAREYTITKTNGNTYGAYPRGITYSGIGAGNRSQSGQSDNTNFPIFGTVLTVNSGSSRFYQIMHVNTHSREGHWTRHYYVDTWSVWKRVLSTDDAEDYPRTRRVSNVADLNNNTTMESGMFVVKSGSTIGLPIQDWYHVINLKHYNEDGYNAQIALRLSSGEGMFFRNSNGGTWRPWRRLDSGDVYNSSTKVTIIPAHQNCLLRLNNASGTTVTVPKDDDIPINTDITIMQYNTGHITFVPATDVIIRSVDGNLKTNGRYTAVTLRKIAEVDGVHYWVLVGALTS